jgi:hypothetical protein
MKDQAFVIRVGNAEAWKAIADDRIIVADFKSKGAALGAIAVEKRKSAKRAERAADYQRPGADGAL